MSRLGRWKWRLLLALLGVLLAAALGPRWIAGPTVPGLRVERATLVQTVSATGRVRPPSRLEVATVQLATVRRSTCREGLRVEAGALLFELRDESQRAALAEAQAQAAQAEVRLEEATGPGRRSDLEALRRAELALAEADDRLRRLERLTVGQAVAESQVAEARRNRQVAESQLESARTTALGTESRGVRLRLLEAERARARAAVAAAQVRLEETRIVAPVAGVLATCEVVAGEIVTAGKVLAVLVADGPLEIVIEPDEKNLARLKVGQAAKVVADAFPDYPFEAEVATVVPAVDPVRGTIEVRLRAPTPPAGLIPDLTVSVEIECARRAEALTIPREVVQRAGDEPWVWVHEDGRARRRVVGLGLVGQENVEVLTGLEVGQVVLAPAALPLTEGARVRAALPGG